MDIEGKINMQKTGFYVRIGKRYLDVVLSTCALVVLSPLMAVTAVLVRNKLGSPVIFKQSRAGLHGKTFTMYKFRSMSNEKDANGELLPDEVRLTKFGKLLRSTSLDELPELVNIIKGDMSIIGPRPLLPEYVERYNETQIRRLDVKPGLSNISAISGRNALTWDEKFEMDVWYVDHLSFALDAKIVVKTIKAVITRKGVTAQDGNTRKAFLGKQEDIKK